MLKDADGLDRVRLGDLDVSFLRITESKTMVLFAEQLFRVSERELQPGENLFPEMWALAEDIDKHLLKKRSE